MLLRWGFVPAAGSRSGSVGGCGNGVGGGGWLSGSGSLKTSPRVVARVTLVPNPKADRLEAYVGE